MSLSQLRTWARTILHGRDDRRRPGRPRLEWLEERLTPDAVSWTGGGDGVNWSDARNWSTLTRLPGPADDVTINAPGAFIIHASGADSVHSLQSGSDILLSGGSLALASDSAIDATLVLTGGTLSAAGPLTLGTLEQTGGTLGGAGTAIVRDQWDWSGGTESGGHTVLLGNADFSGPLGFFTTLQLSGRAVDNDGTATLLSNCVLNFSGGAAWNNQPDGTFELQGGGTLTGAGQVNNAGLLLKSGTGTSGVGPALSNTGTVEVQAGALNLGTGSSLGNFNVEAGAALNLSNSGFPSFAFLDGATVTGDGTFQVGTFNPSTSVTVSGGVSMQNLVITFSTVTVNAGASLDVQDLALRSLALLTGPGDVAVENDFVWARGTLGGTGDTVLNGTTEIGDGLGGSDCRLDGRTADNHGTATLLPLTDFIVAHGATWNNHSDATLVLQQGSSVGGTSPARLNNDGLILATGSTGFSVPFSNNTDGTVDIEADPVRGTGSLGLSTGSDAGAFIVGASCFPVFDAVLPGYAFLDGATVTGDGLVQTGFAVSVSVSGSVFMQNLRLFNGRVTVNAGASLDVQNLRLDMGELTGPGDVTVEGDLAWSFGVMSGTGQTFLEGTTTVGGFFSSPSPLTDRTVNNDGAATFGSSGMVIQGNGVWNNDAGATTVLQGGVSTVSAGPQAAFNNAGLLQKTGATAATISVPLSNADSGTLDVQAGTLSLGASPPPFQTSGTVVVEAGATFLVGSYTQTDGLTTVDGTLTVINPATGGVFLDGGLLNGGGTINGNVTNAAELAPGDSPGVLTINGNYTQTADGILDIEIGGTTVGSQYDRLAINGTATLAGTLNVIILNGFVPDPGTAFGVLTFHSHSGDFDAENGLDLGGGLSLAPVYAGDDTGLSLVATQSG